MNKHKTKISRRLSYILRHAPEKAGLTLENGGWVSVKELLTALSSRGPTISMTTLEEVVRDNDKQRFSFNEDQTKIRANQGHSVDVDLNLTPLKPPAVLYHGTVERFIGLIFEKGLIKGNRHHVHMTTDIKTALKVGSRRGTPIVLKIEAEQMSKEGFLFFRSGNGVWLTETVPPAYLERSTP